MELLPAVNYLYLNDEGRKHLGLGILGARLVTGILALKGVYSLIHGVFSGMNLPGAGASLVVKGVIYLAISKDLWKIAETSQKIRSSVSIINYQSLDSFAQSVLKGTLSKHVYTWIKETF